MINVADHMDAVDNVSLYTLDSSGYNNAFRGTAGLRSGRYSASLTIAQETNYSHLCQLKLLNPLLQM